MTMPTTNFTVDFARLAGPILPLHGGNNGPLRWGCDTSLTPWHRRLRIPFVRLHDCDYPGDYLVDIHAVFPNPDADPEDPASYDFINTDDYISSIVALGSQIVYRLGCRIEHTRRRRHTMPPADPARWARICLGIIRHYNAGWANGHHWNIRCWEIWNEPDIPPANWAGTWEDYFQLYAAAATAIKAEFPGVQVGGPAYAIGIPHLVRGEEQTFARAFLVFCREHNLPLDFFSWHTYAVGDLTVWERRARAYRKLLDELGFTATESHLNEWNCLALPGSGGPSWAGTDAMQGPIGASAVAASLIYFQDLPLDQAFLYTLDDSTYGLFSRAGQPMHNYRAVEAFTSLLDTPRRCATTGSDSARGLAILAGLAEDGRSARVLVANYIHCPQVRFPLHLLNLPWSVPTAVSIRRIDADHELTESERQILEAGDATINFGLPRASVVLIDLKPAAAGLRPGPLVAIDGLAALRVERVALTVTDSGPALAVTVINHTAEAQSAHIATTFAPAWLTTAPAWSGILPAGGDGRSTCLLPLAIGRPDADRTLRLRLHCDGRTWPIAAELPVMVSGQAEVLADWAILTPTLDADGLRFHVEVTDDLVLSHNDDLTKPRSPWQGSCVEFFCDWDRAGDFNQPGHNKDDVHLVCTPPGKAFGVQAGVRVLGSCRLPAESLTYTARRTNTGWTCDLTIPWQAIEAVGGKRDRPIACSVSVRAVDSNFGERQWVAWSGGNDNWCDTTGFGLLLPS